MKESSRAMVGDNALIGQDERAPTPKRADAAAAAIVAAGNGHGGIITGLLLLLPLVAYAAVVLVAAVLLLLPQLVVVVVVVVNALVRWPPHDETPPATSHLHHIRVVGRDAGDFLNGRSPG